MAYNNRGIAYTVEGEYTKAVADFSEAIRLDPDCARVYYNRGITYQLIGEKAKAVVDFNKFITLTNNPEWVEMIRLRIEELTK
ncbi:tetratricopeptide repeat protein [Chloroflexota bacterium]